MRPRLGKFLILLMLLPGAAPGAVAQDHPLGEPSPEQSAPQPGDVTGLWRGSYVCLQGETGVELAFTEAGHPGYLRGTFKFFNLPGQSNVRPGEYSVTGLYDESERSLHVEPTAWIVRPPGYTMVGFSAQLDASARTLAGRIDDKNCSTISVERAAAE
ncbi:MAG: hypothetical protein JO273_10940 [Methylobacteriaceae bacterium]|nr:hypothetical protein [Methylobacteriaceae bacterium]